MLRLHDGYTAGVCQDGMDALQETIDSGLFHDTFGKYITADAPPPAKAAAAAATAAATAAAASLAPPSLPVSAGRAAERAASGRSVDDEELAHLASTMQRRLAQASVTSVTAL